MVRHNVKKFSRGEWTEESMASALENVKEGRTSCLTAANAFNVPDPTLCHPLKKNENEMPVQGVRFREVFSVAQQEALKSYFTAMGKMLLGLTKKQFRRIVLDFDQE
ncbi:hypothetical protein TNCV_3707081 [Trichonephila clavipes]|nr:hypothetical protein TNCV_3707081 [Trichonephila clavipes]